MSSHGLFLRVLVLLGLILFGFYLAGEQGLITLTLEADRSYISYVILGIYAAASVHWLYVALRLSREKDALASIARQQPASVELARYLAAVQARREKGQISGHDALLEAFSDRIHNRHAAGQFTADVLLRLGLLGTIVGFILMLLPVGDLNEFDPVMLQRMISEMSGGMAVALYTTLAGLVTSTLLKLQYQVLDSSAAALVTDLAEFTQVHLSSEPPLADAS